MVYKYDYPHRDYTEIANFSAYKIVVERTYRSRWWSKSVYKTAHLHGTNVTIIVYKVGRKSKYMASDFVDKVLLPAVRLWLKSGMCFTIDLQEFIYGTIGSPRALVKEAKKSAALLETDGTADATHASTTTGGHNEG